ncbi:hypothetical protein [Streptococcus sanguinis]|uniref:Uncharacterized protein n=1 Tax=Streptococcus sanguinis TaxID=1305 RepID=A0A7H8UZG9_STRSA|nr:hypothetical protein [Streptococcus sanguinis]QLB49653.1 hypothetical protein FDP16_03325 [Streptococcus sanguinis]
MAYLPEERETVIRYDEQEDSWYFETNVRRHITRIQKRLDQYEILAQELDDAGRVIYLQAKMIEGTVSPFAKPRRKPKE